MHSRPVTTVDYQYINCTSAWTACWQCHWNVSLSRVLEHAQYCEENKGAALARSSFVGTRNVPGSPIWTWTEFFPTLPPGLVEGSHLGKWCRTPAVLTDHLLPSCLGNINKLWFKMPFTDYKLQRQWKTKWEVPNRTQNEHDDLLSSITPIT